MFIDEPVDKVQGRNDWAHWTLLLAATVFCSPLGYLLTGWLDTLATKASAALFLAA
jgi:NADH-quinone oxidoreductase subunit N